jgi:hypothetical protein
MAQFMKIFPSRFGTENTTIAEGNSAFSDLTLASMLTFWRPWYEFPGCFARESASGASMSIRITANDTATQDHEILAVLPGPDVNQNGGVMCRSTASWTTQPNGHVKAYLWGDGRLYVDRITTGGSSATVASVDLVALQRDTRPILCRLRVTGAASATRVQCKVWSFQQNEPAPWTVDTTLGVTLNADGFPVLYRSGTGFPAFLGMAFSVGTDSDEAPSFVGTISGQVRVNGTSQGGRTVRAVAREDPGYVFETVSDGSGNFALKVLKDFTYSVYAMDELTGDFNAVMFDKIVPV